MKTVKVGDLVFRTEGGLIKPSEIFFASAGRHFQDGEREWALSLLEVFLKLAPDDQEARDLKDSIMATGVSADEIPIAVTEAVRQEYDRFLGIPAKIRDSMILPENHIALHPLNEMTQPHNRWVLEQELKVRTEIVSQNGKKWDQCEVLEYDVFTSPEVAYCEPNEAGRIPDFDVFDQQEFVAAWAGDRLVGVMRVVYSQDRTMREGLFQTYDHRRELNIFPAMERHLASLDPSSIVDMSSMAILAEARDSAASKCIITRTMKRIWETGRRHALACIDTPFYQKLKERALPFQDLGPSTYYWGSPTTATIIDTYSIPRGWQKVFIPLCHIKGMWYGAGNLVGPNTDR